MGWYVLTRKCVHLRENTQITSLHAEKCFRTCRLKNNDRSFLRSNLAYLLAVFSIVAFEIFSIDVWISYRAKPYPGKTLFTHSPKAGVNW